MNLYLVRHGPAVEFGEHGVTRDADRMLSQEGRKKTKEAALGLKRVPDLEVDRIVSSPLIRARETAEIIASVIAPGCAVETAREMEPGTPPDRVAHWLGGLLSGSTMLVGHMPDLSYLASRLVCPAGAVEIPFKKAAILCLSFANRIASGGGQIEWLLQPGILRALARAAD